MDVLIVGGHWDERGGRPSSLVQAFVHGVEDTAEEREGITVRVSNGGDSRNLRIMARREDEGPNILFWFPDVPNEVEKEIGFFKERNSHLILVGSKRLDDRDIGFPDIIDRMLRTKQNLCLVIDKVEGRYWAKLIDPLGNLFYHGDDFYQLGRVAMKRALYLKSVRRIPSVYVGSADHTPPVPVGFLQLIRRYAHEFDNLVLRPREVSRFLGNAAFRCSHGFPAFRGESGVVYVSRRNVDKNGIGPESFVALQPYRPFDSFVKFYSSGPEVKPSVDAPLDLLLFHYMPHIKYLLHGHVYVEGALMTKHPVPCGAIEEIDEVLQTLQVTDKSDYRLSIATNFCVNLRGHGFIVGGSNLHQLRDLEFYARPVEEPVP